MTGKITGALREQSDWAQNDEHRLGFIKNKPFYDTRKEDGTGELKTIDPKYLPSGGVGYTESTKKTLLTEQTFEPTEIEGVTGLYVFDIDPPFSPVVGDKFTVNWNGTRYVCKAVSKVQDEHLIFGFGNQGLLSDDGGTGEPFMYSEIEGETGMFITLGTEPVTLSVTTETETVHTIDPKFLPSGYFDLTPYFGQCETIEPTSLQGECTLEIEETKKLVSAFAEGRYIGVARDTVESDGMQMKVILPFKKAVNTPNIMFAGYCEDNMEFGVGFEGDVSFMSLYILE